MHRRQPRRGRPGGRGRGRGRFGCAQRRILAQRLLDEVVVRRQHRRRPATRRGGALLAEDQAPHHVGMHAELLRDRADRPVLAVVQSQRLRLDLAGRGHERPPGSRRACVDRVALVARPAQPAEAHEAGAATTNRARNLSVRRAQLVDEDILACIDFSSAAIGTDDRLARRGGGHTRAEDNFWGTLIPYAAAMGTQAVALVGEHQGVAPVPSLRGGDHGAPTGPLAALAAVRLSAIAATAHVEHHAAVPATRLAEGLHRGAAPSETCPSTRTRRRCEPLRRRSPSRVSGRGSEC